LIPTEQNAYQQTYYKLNEIILERIPTKELINQGVNSSTPIGLAVGAMFQAPLTTLKV
jgi:hypothetical protein